ncbi:hypothetical protein SAMN04488026_10994 [Aliiruegeria lutimaris]|uniref:Uncharacterized protein n=1 Tax=Aliiruegeria lutimaris TaxID=571298 RepID=A0A1G9LMC3_9RHOB|nr:hypothetical protein SAMN04488026_10994 [Aliiruegeria lutimaris]
MEYRGDCQLQLLFPDMPVSYGVPPRPHEPLMLRTVARGLSNFGFLCFGSIALVLGGVVLPYLLVQLLLGLGRMLGRTAANFMPMP